MRAVVRERGMVLKTDHPVPVAPTGENVLVRVRAASINPVDYKAPKLVLGAVVGLDFAGVVEAVAEGAPKHGFQVGDEVFGWAENGSLADLTIAKASKLTRKPQSISFVQAASLPTAYATSLQALRDHGNLKPGGRALVIGASGGCGLSGVQLANTLGADQVVGVCSGRNREVVERLGAHRVVDYTTEKVEALFGRLPDSDKFDVVYDAATGSGAGEAYEAASWEVLKPTGQYVPINGNACAFCRFATGCQKARMHLFLTNQNSADLDTLAGYVEMKTLEVVIASTFPFTDEGVADAFKMLGGRRTVGKIVVDMEREEAI